MEIVNCRRCKHFYITWDFKAPNGCRAFAFKSIGLPCLLVFRNSGQKCQLFEAKDND